MDEEIKQGSSDEERNLSKKERAELRKQEKEAQRRKRMADKRNALVVKVGIAILVLAGIGYWMNSAVQKNIADRPGIAIPIQGKNHIKLGDSHDPYSSNPPTSGPHANNIDWGVYTEEVRDENVVHNLEHGGIWISYKDLTPDEVTQLVVIAKKHPQSVLLSPRSANDSRVAVASWGRLMKLDTVDTQAIEGYITSNINKSPEPFAR